MIKKLTDKQVKVKRMVPCARKECDKLFPQRGPKKYCSTKCQWTVYNEAHPIMRKV